MTIFAFFLGGVIMLAVVLGARWLLNFNMDDADDAPKTKSDPLEKGIHLVGWTHDGGNYYVLIARGYELSIIRTTYGYVQYFYPSLHRLCNYDYGTLTNRIEVFVERIGDGQYPNEKYETVDELKEFITAKRAMPKEAFREWLQNINDAHTLNHQI